jgi:GNAT superfamily N-acetyltransferase
MRAASVPRLYEQRVYRNLPCFHGTDRENTYAVGCCYIAETERSRGLARALLTAAVTEARAAGAAALEAFPRGGPPAESPPLRADEVWMGPEALFRSAGFERVSDFRPYPVLRLHLR